MRQELLKSYQKGVEKQGPPPISDFGLRNKQRWQLPVGGYRMFVFNGQRGTGNGLSLSTEGIFS
jgi:hypothetical protein